MKESLPKEWKEDNANKNYAYKKENNKMPIKKRTIVTRMKSKFITIMLTFLLGFL